MHAAAGPRRLRLVAPESLHVTLCFLGARPMAETAAIAAAVRESSDPAAVVAVEIGAPVWLPARRPRVGVCTLIDASGALGALQARLAGRLLRGGWYEPERRPFLAHVTVARLGGGGSVEMAGRAAPAWPVTPAGPAVGRFAAPAVTLFRSHTGSGGASYEALTTVALPA